MPQLFQLCCLFAADVDLNYFLDVMDNNSDKSVPHQMYRVNIICAEEQKLAIWKSEIYDPC